MSARMLVHAVLIVAALVGAAPIAHSEGLEKPAGWMGPWPPKSQQPGSPTPGGGDGPPKAAIPAPAAASDAPAAPPQNTEVPALAPEEAPRVAVASTGLVPMEPRRGDGHVAATRADSARPALTVNGAGLDIPRASLPVEGASALPIDSLKGQYTWSTDKEKEPPFVYVQYGFSTTIELLNGETPAGGAICGLCGKDGAFEVTKVSNRIGIKPREASSPERGVLASNVTIFTSSGRTLTFVVVEVSGMGLRRTDRHEVRSSRGDGDMVVSFTGEAQIEEATRKLEAQYQADLQEAKSTLLDTKLHERFESYSDFDVEAKAKGREITIESVATVGDRTIIKFHAPADVSLSTPVAMVAYGKQLRVLQTKHLTQERKTVDGDDWVFVSLTTEPVTLTGHQRLAVSMSDLDHGKEMRSSAGRG